MANRVQEVLFPRLEASPVLKQLFSKLLQAYTRLNFGMAPTSFVEKEINQLISFASLLSKSNDSGQKVISEQIVALLGKLYPASESVRKAKAEVLSSCTNYVGMKAEKMEGRSDDVFQEISSEIQMESLKIPFQDGKFFIDDQKEIFDSFEKYQFVSYSAPTSLGKSFVMRIYLKYKVASGYRGNFAIIVPTKALINEMRNSVVEEDLKDLLRKMHYREVSSVNEVFVTEDKESKFIFIVTPERLHYLLNSTDIAIDCCFVDESYKISEPDSRSLYYYQAINQLLVRNPKTKIFFSSPNIPNPEVYLETIKAPGTRYRKATGYSPVSQIKYLISLKEKDQPIKVFNDLTRDLENTGMTNPSTNINDIISTLKTKGGNIVYCSGKDKTVELALQYANFLPAFQPSTPEEKENQEKLDALAKSIEQDVHEDYYLAALIRKGVAYHVGYLPNSLRNSIEKAFKTGLIKTIFCTSTLMEGVNLPADNLFVTSTRNGLEAMSPTAFKNLLGRIGRINYSLFGNVYLLVIPRYANAEKYEELLTSKVEPQKLSLDKIVTDGSIVDHISDDAYFFGREDENQTKRIASNIYINDVKNGTESLIRERVDSKSEETLVDKAIRKIELLETSESIDISPDQHVSLKNYIENGGHYPDPVNGRFEHSDVWRFLNELSDIYKWDKYEFETLKNGNSNSYFATVLSQWMSGLKVKEIVDRTIESKKKNPYDAIFDRKLNMKVDYIGTVEQNNIIINDTLRTIEQTILFTIANYFREFSREYKNFHRLEYFDNDWYEYVEFGTSNPITIALQRNGYIRETAKWIHENDSKYHLIDQTRRCKFAPFTLDLDNLLKCGEQKVIEETLVIKLNVPELFR